MHSPQYLLNYNWIHQVKWPRPSLLFKWLKNWEDLYWQLCFAKRQDYYFKWKEEKRYQKASISIQVRSWQVQNLTERTGFQTSFCHFLFWESDFGKPPNITESVSLKAGFVMICIFSKFVVKIKTWKSYSNYKQKQNFQVNWKSYWPKPNFRWKDNLNIDIKAQKQIW